MENFKGYQYNECNVCANPDKPYAYGEFSGLHYSIEISETPRGWVYGYICSIHLSGQGKGCMYHAKETFMTKSEAIVECAKRIKQFFLKNKGSRDVLDKLDRIMAEESGETYIEEKQLTLSDCL